MNIEINVFDVNSIIKAEKELRAYKRTLRQKADRICEELAKIGLEKVRVTYANADYTITPDLAVTVVPIPNGYSIKASGTDVLFVEFGTGYIHANEWGNQNGLPVGSFSDSPQGKGHWDNPLGWWYPGGGSKWEDRTFGNEPAMAFKYAQDEILLNLTRIAKEALND